MSGTFGLLSLNQQTTGESDTLLGVEYEVEDLDFSSATLAPGYPRLSNKMILVCRVRASETITAGQAVKWTSSYEGTRVSVAGDGEVAVGVCSPYISSVASGGHFLIVRRGPAKIVSDGGGALSAGNVVVTAASGEVNIQTAAPADTTAAMVQVNSRVGRVLETIAATAHLKGRAYIDCTSN